MQLDALLRRVQGPGLCCVSRQLPLAVVLQKPAMVPCNTCFICQCACHVLSTHMQPAALSRLGMRPPASSCHGDIKWLLREVKCCQLSDCNDPMVCPAAICVWLLQVLWCCLSGSSLGPAQACMQGVGSSGSPNGLKQQQQQQQQRMLNLPVLLTKSSPGQSQGSSAIAARHSECRFLVRFDVWQLTWPGSFSRW
jgi:hypothetical protein